MHSRFLYLVPNMPLLCTSPPTCHSAALHQPPVHHHPVFDDAGTQYAYDLVFTQGFYLVAALFFGVLSLRNRL